MKLPVKDQILFAVGGLGENITFQAMTAWLIFFWSGRADPDQALIPIGLLGILLGIGRVVEAFDDPLIGHISDQTRSRFGRRFPYIFFGAPLLALSFFLLWTPAGDSVVTRSIYFFLALQFFFFTYTLVSAPYEGILPEIAKTSADRVSTSAWRALFGVIGAAGGLVGSGILIEKVGFQAMGVVLGLVGLAAFWIAIFGIRKRLTRYSSSESPNRDEARTISLKEALLSTLKNTQFIVFSLGLILFSLGQNLLTALLPFYVTVILGKPAGLVSLFMGALLLSMLIALPVQTKLASRFTKKRMYAFSMLVLGLLFPFLALTGLLPAFDSFLQTGILTILIGLALSGQFVFPNAILADVIDYDETKTGLRREAIYYGMQNTLQKFSFALASIIFGTTLSIFGSTAENPLGIRLIGPVAGLATLAGFLIFIKGYRLPDQVKSSKIYDAE